MKYANLYWQSTEIDNAYKVNIGDNLQFLTIDYLYNKMGKSEEIVKLKIKEVKDYSGKDYLVLPLNWSLFDSSWMEDDKIAISPKIIPVFLAVTLGAGHNNKFFNQFNIEYLKKHEPIGCRDEITLLALRKYNISAYLNGCLTAILPLGDSDKRDTVYFIDVPLSLKKYIPTSLYDKCKYVTHQKYYDTDYSIDSIIDEIKTRYEEYNEKAKLVVTSRLHAASPCMAMGIPVIFVKDIVDERFSWLDKYIPLYERNQWESINWDSKRVEYEDIKEKIINFTIKRIITTFEKNREWCEISECYEDREKREYADFRNVLAGNIGLLDEWLNQNWNIEEKEYFSIWGITGNAENLVRYIKKRWPKASLRNAIDQYKEGYIEGVKISKYEITQLKKNDTLLVLAVGAVKEVKKLIKEGYISEDKCYFIADCFMDE